MSYQHQEALSGVDHFLILPTFTQKGLAELHEKFPGSWLLTSEWKWAKSESASGSDVFDLFSVFFGHVKYFSEYLFFEYILLR